jgi:hypothetical protein
MFSHQALAHQPNSLTSCASRSPAGEIAAPRVPGLVQSWRFSAAPGLPLGHSNRGPSRQCPCITLLGASCARPPDDWDVFQKMRDQCGREATGNIKLAQIGQHR